jgi:hypothetical protein
VVHSYSSISLRAHAEQSSFEPGTRVVVYGVVSEAGIPSAAATVWADITRPDGHVVSVAMNPEPGEHFVGAFDTSAPGVYRIRVRARGLSARGEAFTRERTLTAAVWRGGDRMPVVAGDSPGADATRDGLCALLECLLRADGMITGELEQRLRSAGLDLDRARRCLTDWCKRDD